MTKTEIANLAISHLGIGKDISDLDTERSEEARACKKFYSETLKLVLRDFPWPFANKVAALALIEEDPTTEWAYSYQYPTDCACVRRILSGVRMDTNGTEIPYQISGQVIYTDAEDAVIEYTKLETDGSLYPADFTMALSWRLALYIAPRITAGDQFKLAQTASQMYRVELSQAQANSLNEERNDPTPESEFIRGRV